MDNATLDSALTKAVDEYRRTPLAARPTGWWRYIEGLYFISPLGAWTHPLHHRIMLRLWEQKPDLAPEPPDAAAATV